MPSFTSGESTVKYPETSCAECGRSENDVDLFEDGHTAMCADCCEEYEDYLASLSENSDTNG
jgi:hypothetical protein